MNQLLWVTLAALVVVTFAKPQMEEEEEVIGGYENEVEDPCSRKHCGPGRECDLTEDGTPVCMCAHKCASEPDSRAKVCSTTNVTFSSECELYRQKCLCHRAQPGCEATGHKHAHLDYFGVCQEIPECTDWELREFPRRMRNWLYLVMEELSDRRDLSGPAEQLAEEAKKKSTKKWVLPVLWKFCDLDMSRDSRITTRELLPISAPLKTLEHCTGPFLAGCDTDRSGDISLEEWGLCLGLDLEEIEDQCDAIRQ